MFHFIFDLRDEWVRELRNSKKVSAMKVDTMKNIADMMTKCLSATVRERLMFELSSIARNMAHSYIKLNEFWRVESRVKIKGGVQFE